MLRVKKSREVKGEDRRRKGTQRSPSSVKRGSPYTTTATSLEKDEGHLLHWDWRRKKRMYVAACKFVSLAVGSWDSSPPDASIFSWWRGGGQWEGLDHFGEQQHVVCQAVPNTRLMNGDHEFVAPLICRVLWFSTVKFSHPETATGQRERGGCLVSLGSQRIEILQEDGEVMVWFSSSRLEFHKVNWKLLVQSKVWANLDDSDKV